MLTELLYNLATKNIISSLFFFSCNLKVTQLVGSRILYENVMECGLRYLFFLNRNEDNYLSFGHLKVSEMNPTLSYLTFNLLDVFSNF